MEGIPVGEINNFIADLVEMFETEHRDICDRIDSSGQLDDDLKADIIEISKDFREKAGY
jgi:F0F1-type ATP synthase alpha subunit